MQAGCQRTASRLPEGLGCKQAFYIGLQEGSPDCRLQKTAMGLAYHYLKRSVWASWQLQTNLREHVNKISPTIVTFPDFWWVTVCHSRYSHSQKVAKVSEILLTCSLIQPCSRLACLVYTVKPFYFAALMLRDLASQSLLAPLNFLIHLSTTHKRV